MNGIEDVARGKVEVVKWMSKILRVIEAQDKYNGDTKKLEKIKKKIASMPLSIEVSKEYIIMLSWVKPPVRIRGWLEDNVPVTTVIEFCDEETNWLELPLTTKQEEALLRFAREFYYE